MPQIAIPLQTWWETLRKSLQPNRGFSRCSSMARSVEFLTGAMTDSRRPFALAIGFLLVLMLLIPTAVFGQANVVGQWSILANQSPINPIHVALLPRSEEHTSELQSPVH